MNLERLSLSTHSLAVPVAEAAHASYTFARQTQQAAYLRELPPLRPLEVTILDADRTFSFFNSLYA